jgi:polysaccharide biosynthesis protein PslH
VVPITAGGGVRLKMLEALGRAKAVLTTTYGAQGLPVADGVHLLIADTPEVMAGKLIAALTDSNMRQALGAAGSELAHSHYTESVVMGTLQVFYKALLEPETTHVPSH